MTTDKEEPGKTPIFDDVVAEQGWHPEQVRPALNVGAMVAASYDKALKAKGEPVRTRGAKPVPPSKAKTRQRRTQRR